MSSVSEVVYLALGEDVGPGKDDGRCARLQLVSSLASAACVVAGIAVLRRSRLRAYRWFQRAVLISILVTHVFVFYDSQLAALTGLAVSLLVYAALRFAIAREEADEASRRRRPGANGPRRAETPLRGPRTMPFTYSADLALRPSCGRASRPPKRSFRPGVQHG